MRNGFRNSRWCRIGGATSRWWGVIFGACVALGCQRETTFADVMPILVEKCNPCHLGGVATLRPYFSSYENVRSLGWVMRDAIVSREMPPFGMDNTLACGDNFFDPEGLVLTTAEIETFTDWIDQGMIAGDLGGLPRISMPQQPTLGNDAVRLRPASPYRYAPFRPETMSRCFVVEPELVAGAPEGGFVTGFRVSPTNESIVQNVSLHVVEDEEAIAQVYALEESELEPGYPCFGGPTVDASFLGSWVWGRPVVRFPEGTGIRFDMSKPIVLQVRYNPQGGGTSPEPDHLEVMLELSDDVREAKFLTLAAHAFSLRPGMESAFARVSHVATEGFDVLAVAPVMHSLGHRMELSRRRRFSDTCLARVNHWEFHNHLRIYRYATPPRSVIVGDELHLECEYETRARLSNTFEGQDHLNEQCLTHLYIAQ